MIPSAEPRLQKHHYSPMERARGKSKQINNINLAWYTILTNVFGRPSATHAISFEVRVKCGQQWCSFASGDRDGGVVIN